MAVGKLKDRHWIDATDDYYKRIRRKFPLTVDELRSAEAAPLRLPRGFELWALDPEGVHWTSDALAKEIQHRLNTSRPGIAFLIGGAEGLPRPVVERAQVRLAISRLTLPHRLVRLILAEQLYRALSIIYGEPYHK